MNNSFLFTLASAKFWWIPIAVFLLIIVIGFTIGIINGGKTATYYLIWNVVILVAAIFACVAFREKIWDFVFSQIKAKANFTNIELQQIVELIGPTLKIIFSAFATMIIFFGGNILAFILYWPLRKRLKVALWNGKKGKKGQIAEKFYAKSKTKSPKLASKWHRVIGAVIGGVVAAPPTLFATSLFLGLSNYRVSGLSKNFNSFVVTSSKIASYGQYKNFPQEIEKVKVFLEIPGHIEGLTLFQALINEQIGVPYRAKLKEDFKPKLTQSINNDKSFFEDIFRLPSVLANFKAWIKTTVEVIGSDGEKVGPVPIPGALDKVPLPAPESTNQYIGAIKSLEIPKKNLVLLSKVLEDKIYTNSADDIREYLLSLGHSEDNHVVTKLFIEV